MDLSPWLDRVGGPRNAAIIIVAVVLALVILRRLLARPASSPHLATARCPSCGWTGSVSRYKPICPRCAKAIPLA